MVDIARKLNPDIEIVLRSDTEDGAALLRARSSARCSWARRNSPAACAAT
jgi:hypothetical protein